MTLAGILAGSGTIYGAPELGLLGQATGKADTAVMKRGWECRTKWKLERKIIELNGGISKRCLITRG